MTVGPRRVSRRTVKRKYRNAEEQSEKHAKMSRRSRKKVVERSRTCEAAEEDRSIDDVFHAQAERPDKRLIQSSACLKILYE